MGFFDLFRRKATSNNGDLHPDNGLPEIYDDTTSDHPDPNAKPESPGFGIKSPIDVIYNYLSEDYENRAYNDALTNPDISYKDTNLLIIRSNLEVKFKQVLLTYDNMLRELDFHIQSRAQAGLSDVVELLKVRKATYEQHVQEIHRMKGDLDRGELYMSGIFKSYEVGYLRGLASISLTNLNK